MDDLDRPAIREPLRRVTREDRQRPVLVLIGIALLIVLVGVVEPWPAATPVVADPPAPSDVASAQASPDTTPDPYEPLRVVCGSPGGWRAATIHRWPNRAAPIRTWSSIEPAGATDAADPDIPFVDVVAAVTALGYCSPRGPAGAPEDTTAQIWLVDGSRTRQLDAPLAEPATAHPLGGVWAPPPDARARILDVDAWRPGRYAVRIAGTAFDRWVGIEIREPPGPDDPGPARSLTPDASAAASASPP